MDTYDVEAGDFVYVERDAEHYVFDVEATLLTLVFPRLSERVPKIDRTPLFVGWHRSAGDESTAGGCTVLY